MAIASLETKSILTHGFRRSIEGAPGGTALRRTVRQDRTRLTASYSRQSSQAARKICAIHQRPPCRGPRTRNTRGQDSLYRYVEGRARRESKSIAPLHTAQAHREEGVLPALESVRGD